MKTINGYYTNKANLKKFIEKNNIKNSNKILLQIFTAICDENFITSLLKELKEFLPNINIIGSTTDGEINNSKVSQNSTVLSFSIFNDTAIKVYSILEKESSYQTAKNLIHKIEDINNAQIGILFADGLNINGEIFLNAFNDIVPSLKVAGGLAGDNSKFIKTFVFTQDSIDNSAVVAVLYNPNLIVSTELSFGWETIGREFTVTKAIDNRVYSIDNQTPLSLYGKYLGETIKNQLPATGIEFPLIVNRNGNKIARAVFGKEDDGSLIFAGNICVGDKVAFGYGNIENIVGNIKPTHEKIIQNPVESIFIYSCMARKKLLGKDIQTELQPLLKIAPTSGFFTYGEFYHYQKNSICEKQLLNQTMTILALSEKNEIKNFEQDIELPDFYKNTQTVKVLSSLVAESIQELNRANDSLEIKIKQALEEARQKDKQLLQQSRHAQMGEMISMIAHQWRQPLAAISATSASIAFKAKLKKLDDNLAIELAEKISSFSTHLSSTIDDFREFFKINKEKSLVLPEELIFSILNIIETSIKNKKIYIKKDLKFNEQIYTYPNELKQVILNLIKNSEDALLENKINNPYIKIKICKEQNNFVVKIKDNAGGISSDIIDKIFDPYFSTKTKKDGTGLGLYMSKTIIEEHCGGKLSAENSEDGALLKIELPLDY